MLRQVVKWLFIELSIVFWVIVGYIVIPWIAPFYGLHVGF